MAKPRKEKPGITNEEWDLKKKLSNEFGKLMPTVDEIASQVLHDVVAAEVRYPGSMRANLSTIITSAYEDMSTLYFQHERASLGGALFHGFRHFAIDDVSDGVLEAIRAYPKALDEFFLSVSQGRKARAGSTFEKLLAAVFRSLGYEFTEQPSIDGKPDFVFPSVEHYRRAAMDCIVFTAKTTLRERWRQITTEGAKGGAMFLATLDDSITDDDLREMSMQRIYVVVPKSMKDTHYEKHVNAVSFESFLAQFLDPSVLRWQT